MSYPKRSEVKLKTGDGVTISIDHYRGRSGELLIICPGFLMHKRSKPFSLLAKRLSKEFDVIVIDFRGHGKSSGLYTFTSREGQDLEAALNYSVKSYNSIGIIAFSLGGAVAINVAAKKNGIKRLMVVSAPTEFEKIENRFLNKDVLSSTTRKFGWKMLQVRLGNIFLKKEKPIDNVDKISPAPILFVHGGRDPIIKPWHSKALYKKAREPKRLVIYKDSLHAEDIFFETRVEDFIALCLDWFRGG